MSPAKSRFRVGRLIFHSIDSFSRILSFFARFFLVRDLSFSVPHGPKRSSSPARGSKDRALGSEESSSAAPLAPFWFCPTPPRLAAKLEFRFARLGEMTLQVTESYAPVPLVATRDGPGPVRGEGGDA